MSEEVLIECRGSLGRIRLNRPRALNSLTLEMIRAITAALDRFEHDPAIGAVLISGEGERGLCAGGDIRALYDAGPTDPSFAETFFREEYRLNARIAGLGKPYVAFMDGIVMGGGVGVSAHGSHRLATERTRLAMPEVGIGFFPDVGATWLLPRAPGEIGTYLGLTGAQIGAADAILAGLADVCVPSSCLADLAAGLAALPPTMTGEDVTRLVAGFAQPAATALEPDRTGIDRAFAGDSVTGIIDALAAADSDFARATRAAILAKSPTSLTLALLLLRHGRSSRDLAQCLEREFAACLRVVRGHDFFEGLRAAVVDKDRNPLWSPSALEQIDAAAIEGYLSPIARPLFAHA